MAKQNRSNYGPGGVGSPGKPNSQLKALSPRPLKVSLRQKYEDAKKEYHRAGKALRESK